MSGLRPWVLLLALVLVHHCLTFADTRIPIGLSQP